LYNFAKTARWSAASLPDHAYLIIGVMGGEEDPQKVSERDFRWIVGDADGLGVVRVAAANRFVIRSLGGSSGVSTDDINNPIQLLKYSFSAPEASAGENRIGTGCPW
jgi:hypothetical protein